MFLDILWSVLTIAAVWNITTLLHMNVTRITRCRDQNLSLSVEIERMIHVFIHVVKIKYIQERTAAVDQNP